MKKVEFENGEKLIIIATSAFLAHQVSNARIETFRVLIFALSALTQLEDWIKFVKEEIKPVVLWKCEVENLTRFPVHQDSDAKSNFQVDNAPLRFELSTDIDRNAAVCFAVH